MERQIQIDSVISSYHDLNTSSIVSRFDEMTSKLDKVSKQIDLVKKQR